jgi:steroid 5-alpha reductase family enzyme
MSPLLQTTVATAVAFMAFGVLYVVARRINNYGIVDVGWSYAFGALALFHAVTGQGSALRRATIAAMVCVWSARLGTHLLIRIAKHHPSEDTRYAQLRQDWAGNFGPKMFGFYELQALSVIVLGVGFAVVTNNPAPRLQPLEFAGAALWLVAMIGEAVADAQLATFKRDPRNRSQVCATGLWRYSRHPNYFFEWLIWVAYFVFALASPWGWIAVFAPAAILYLLLRVTGIPMTEQQSMRNRGAAYREYQQTTSAFVPWFRRTLGP